MNVRKITLAICVGILSATCLFCGCKKERLQSNPDQQILLQVGDSVLYQYDIEKQIPSGLNTEDSISLFNSIVERWLRNMIMSDIAASNIKDFDRINLLTEQFRNDLIIDAYMKNKEDEIDQISKSEIDNYYIANEENLIAKAPLVTGIYLKVSENDEKLSLIRKWMKNGNIESIDNLEKYGLKNAAQYDYFKNQWIEWGDLAEKIPYRFYDADAFLKSSKYFETTCNGWVYIIHIYETTHTGEKLPKDYALKKVQEVLRNEKIAEFRRNLLEELYKKGVKENYIKPGLYNPLKHKK